MAAGKVSSTCTAMAGVVAPDTADTVTKQAQRQHNDEKGELGVLFVLCVQCILLLGFAAGRGTTHTLHRVEQV